MEKLVGVCQDSVRYYLWSDGTFVKETKSYVRVFFEASKSKSSSS